MRLLFTFLFGITTSLFAGDFEVKLDDFTKVDARGNFKVTLKQGDHCAAHVINNDEKVEDEKIVLEVKGGVLEIKIKGDTFFERDLEIVITYKKLYGIHSTNGTWLIAEDVLEGQEISLSCNKGGKIKADVKAENLECKISGGGSIKVSGTAELANYEISGGGALAASFLEAKSLGVTVKAGGEVICYATEKLDIQITSGGSVSYKGDPKEFTQNTTLGGKIEKIGE